MRKPVEILPQIYWIGVDDAQTDLFEGLWDIRKEGVSYNSYLIQDEKIAVIDMTKEIMEAEYIQQIQNLNPLNRINYIVINHVEPDHASAIKTIRKLAPDATFLCTERGQKMLSTFYGIEEGVRAVQDGETLSLGKHSLKFVYTPNVHWPETMMTYEETEQVLFSCDAFGGYKMLEGSIFDDDRPDNNEFISESLRYYANIVSNHSHSVLKAFDKLKGIPVKIVAPSHGLVWRKDPQKIMSLYQKWADYQENGGEQRITILYGSMYGNTTLVVKQVEEGIKEIGVEFVSMDVTRTPISYVLVEMWQSYGVLVAAPTYEAALFPPMTSVLQMAVTKKMFNKQTARIGSFGWAGGANRTFAGLLNDLHWNLVDTYEFVGVPKEKDLQHARDFGISFAKSVIH